MAWRRSQLVKALLGPLADNARAACWLRAVLLRAAAGRKHGDPWCMSVPSADALVVSDAGLVRPAPLLLPSRAASITHSFPSIPVVVACAARWTHRIYSNGPLALATNGPLG